MYKMMSISKHVQSSSKVLNYMLKLIKNYHILYLHIISFCVWSLTLNIFIKKSVIHQRKIIKHTTLQDVSYVVVRMWVFFNDNESIIWNFLKNNEKRCVTLFTIVLLKIFLNF